MKAVLVKQPGDSDQLYVSSNVAVPKIKDGQLLVRVSSFGINRMDIIQRKGNYPIPPTASEILGVEYAGVVDKVSYEALSQGFNVGDKVFGLASGGCYAEYVAVNVSETFHLAPDMSFEEAAGIPEVWMTAYQVLLLVGNFKKGNSVLFHGGASGVGLAVNQLAQLYGASMIFVTVGSDAKKEFISTQVHIDGEDGRVPVIPINYKTENFVEVVRKYSPRGIDVVIDPIGSPHFNDNIEIAAIDGFIVNMGVLGGSMVEQLSVKMILHKRLHIVGTTLRSRQPDYKQYLRDQVQSNVIPKIREHKLKLFTERIFNMKDIAQAHKLMESNSTMGKIIVDID